MPLKQRRLTLFVWCRIVQVCGGTTSNDDVQEVNGEISTYIEDEDEGVDSLAAEIEDELEEAIADMIAENEENTNAGEYNKQRVYFIELYGKKLGFLISLAFFAETK